jgi:hypothetical protein
MESGDFLVIRFPTCKNILPVPGIHAPQPDRSQPRAVRIDQSIEKGSAVCAVPLPKRIPATSKCSESIACTEESKIAESWRQENQVDLVQQLGVM